MFENVKAELESVRALAIQVRAEVESVDKSAPKDLGAIDDYFGQIKDEASKVEQRVEEVATSTAEKLEGLLGQIEEMNKLIFEQLDASKYGEFLDKQFNDLAKSLAPTSNASTDFLGPQDTTSGGSTDFLTPPGGG